MFWLHGGCSYDFEWHAGVSLMSLLGPVGNTKGIPFFDMVMKTITSTLNACTAAIIVMCVNAMKTLDCKGCLELCQHMCAPFLICVSMTPHACIMPAALHAFLVT
jgi:hypothetical protein